MRLRRQVSIPLSVKVRSRDQTNLAISLPDTVNDTRLERELTKTFGQYGAVYVKIRRDQRNMPFAFCQFTVGAIKTRHELG